MSREVPSECEAEGLLFCEDNRYRQTAEQCEVPTEQELGRKSTLRVRKKMTAHSCHGGKRMCGCF